MNIKKKFLIFFLIFYANISYSNSAEVNFNKNFIPLKDFIVLKYELFLSENYKRLEKGSGVSHVAYQRIDHEVKINKENKINIKLDAIMSKQRYTSKKYIPKMSDCNQVRNKIFTDKMGYSFFKQTLNHLVNSNTLSNSINQNILNISSLDEKGKDEIINNTYITVNILHPKTNYNISCSGKITDLELR